MPAQPEQQQRQEKPATHKKQNQKQKHHRQQQQQQQEWQDCTREDDVEVELAAMLRLQARRAPETPQRHGGTSWLILEMAQAESFTAWWAKYRARRREKLAAVRFVRLQTDEQVLQAVRDADAAASSGSAQVDQGAAPAMDTAGQELIIDLPSWDMLQRMVALVPPPQREQQPKHRPPPPPQQLDGGGGDAAAGAAGAARAPSLRTLAGLVRHHRRCAHILRWRTTAYSCPRCWLQPGLCVCGHVRTFLGPGDDAHHAPPHGGVAAAESAGAAAPHEQQQQQPTQDAEAQRRQQEGGPEQQQQQQSSQQQQQQQQQQQEGDAAQHAAAPPVPIPVTRLVVLMHYNEWGKTSNSG